MRVSRTLEEVSGSLETGLLWGLWDGWVLWGLWDGWVGRPIQPEAFRSFLGVSHQILLTGKIGSAAFISQDHFAHSLFSSLSPG